MKKRPLLFFCLVSLAATIAGIYFALQRQAATHNVQPVVAALFAQSLPDLQGHPQLLARWQHKPLLVNFWATWCPPCVQEMPELSLLQQQLGVNTLQIIGIGIDTPSNLREFAARTPVSYPLYVGGMDGTELTRQFGNQAGGLPFTVLIDANGSVRQVYRGRLKMVDLRRDIAAVLSR